ncbi:MAG: hypothetical protein M1825_004405 [Sarcosagium campestre]|nr:MAG: hypothetical protein M1825_004405 [Sarcosagium campestre]
MLLDINQKGTRVRFTAEDDAALYDWVISCEKRGESILGNNIYKQLEEFNPRHTYQSWRDRWIKNVSIRYTPTVESLQHHSTTPQEQSPVIAEPALRQGPNPPPAAAVKDDKGPSTNEVSQDRPRSDEVFRSSDARGATVKDRTRACQEQLELVTELGRNWPREWTEFLLEGQELAEISLKTLKRLQRLSRAYSSKAAERALTLAKSEDSLHQWPLPESAIRGSNVTKVIEFLDSGCDESNESAGSAPASPSAIESHGDQRASKLSKSDFEKVNKTVDREVDAPSETLLPTMPQKSSPELLSLQKLHPGSSTKDTSLEQPRDRRRGTLVDEMDDPLRARHESPSKRAKIDPGRSTPSREVSSIQDYETKASEGAIGETEHDLSNASQDDLPHDKFDDFLEIPKPHGGWDAISDANADTQAIYKGPTQNVDVGLAEPSEGWSKNLLGDMEDFLALPPSLNEQSPKESSELDDWIDEMVEKGYAEEEVLHALHCTSMDKRHAELVLTSLAAGTGVPKDIRGVWTPEDDEWLGGGDARLVMTVAQKHGKDALEARLSFLEDYHSA